MPPPSNSIPITHPAIPLPSFIAFCSIERGLRARVGVHLALATSQGDVNEAADVKESLLGTALDDLGLLLRLNLGGLRLDLSSTGEGSVNFSLIAVFLGGETAAKVEN